MIPAIQPSVHPPSCVEGVPGDEVVCSLVVGDVVGGRVGAIVVAIRTSVQAGAVLMPLAMFLLSL